MQHCSNSEARTPYRCTIYLCKYKHSSHCSSAMMSWCCTGILCLCRGVCCPEGGWLDCKSVCFGCCCCNLAYTAYSAITHGMIGCWVHVMGTIPNALFRPLEDARRCHISKTYSFSHWPWFIFSCWTRTAFFSLLPWCCWSYYCWFSVKCLHQDYLFSWF